MLKHYLFISSKDLFEKFKSGDAYFDRTREYIVGINDILNDDTNSVTSKLDLKDDLDFPLARYYTHQCHLISSVLSIDISDNFTVISIILYTHLV